MQCLLTVQKKKKKKYKFTELWVYNFQDYLKLMFNRSNCTRNRKYTQFVTTLVHLVMLTALLSAHLHNKSAVAREFCQGLILSQSHILILKLVQTSTNQCVSNLVTLRKENSKVSILRFCSEHSDLNGLGQVLGTKKVLKL